MRIGLLADIHEHLAELRAALRVLQASGVDQIVVLGDLFETGEQIRETVQLLREVRAVGVWGNHDLGLCQEPEAEWAERYGKTVVDFFGTLSAHFELNGLLFSHGLPTWNATDPTIYYTAERPWEHGALLPVFSNLPHRLMLAGHYHRWLLANTEGVVNWDGRRAITLDPSLRFFLVVHAVMHGWCAVFDTATNELSPHFVCGAAPTEGVAR